MRLLLDTHAFLWFLADSRKLTTSAKTVIEDPTNERLLSAISLVEIAIKVRIDKLRLDDPFSVMFPAELVKNRIELVPIQPEHAAALISLPLHHRDPFDRLIVATALVEGLSVVSSDPLFDDYGVSRIW